MSEKLIRTSELCERLQMGKDAAVAVMAANGVFPIHFGVGRGRGLRWLSSAVDAALYKLHQEAQPKPKETNPKKYNGTNLAVMTIDQIYDLTHA